MPSCTKFFVQYGSEAGNVYTIMLNKSSLKQHSLVLARMALEVIANNKSGINQKHSDSVCRLAQALREAVSSKIEGKQDYISRIPVVHAAMILDKCVNVRALQLDRRCESSVTWQPMLSHFLRRAHTNAVHTKSFRNLGLQLEDTKHTSMPLCDVVESSSGPYSCFSNFFSQICEFACVYHTDRHIVFILL